MNTNRMATLLLGPELFWLVGYGIVLMVAATNQPATEPGNVRLESLSWYFLLGAIALSFVPLFWMQTTLGWSMVRIGIAGLAGIVFLATGFCSKIDYHDSRNSGVGTLWIMLVIFGVILLFLGMIGVSLYVKFKS
ncbi:hypothetical protein GCM10010967_28920 [Dyadobacter beijingensis]|uniref:Uncharacterized protein n=1 Tax=Dyadobacter beijingensis TaxID=365489 RepID=A0ABQ2HZ18_9BACT|nr:hypothetical protein [Dyadobacter beijingensis]GGM93989.1 hypothetical protein GCM10010967_28920 [Dyadobacter beijingensis]